LAAMTLMAMPATAPMVWFGLLQTLLERTSDADSLVERELANGPRP